MVEARRRSARVWHWVWTVLRFVIAAVLLFYLGTSGAIDWSATRRMTDTWWLMPLLVLLSIVGAVTEALRLSFVVRSQEIRISLGEGLRMVLVAMVFGIAVPGGTGGDVMKLYYLVSGHRGRAVEVATVLLAERAIAMLALLFLVCVMGLLNWSLLATHPTLAALVALAAAVLVGTLAAAAVISSKRARAGRVYAYVTQRLPLGRWVERGADALHLLRGHRTAVAGTVAVAMISHLAMALTFIIIAAVLTPDTPARVVPLLAMLGMFANALPITPAGLGVGETAFDRLFGLAGFAGGAVMMITWRIALVPLYGVGCILYVVGRRGQPAQSEA